MWIAECSEKAVAGVTEALRRHYQRLLPSGGGTKFEGKFDGKFEGKFEGKLDGKFEGKFEGKREGKGEGKFEGKE